VINGYLFHTNAGLLEAWRKAELFDVEEEQANIEVVAADVEVDLAAYEREACGPSRVYPTRASKVATGADVTRADALEHPPIQPLNSSFTQRALLAQVLHRKQGSGGDLLGSFADVENTAVVPREA
jgi:hypothetical protein